VEVAPHFPNFSTKWRCDQLLVPVTLPLVPNGQEAELAPELVWKRWQREKIPVSAWNQTPVIQPIAFMP